MEKIFRCSGSGIGGSRAWSFLFLGLLFICNVHAAPELPRLSVPSELSSGEFAEGTITRLSPTEVAEFLPWAQNARNQLNRALTQSRGLPLRDRMPLLERAVQAVVSRSGNRQYQLLMRFALNRGLLLVEELEKSIDMRAIGSLESGLDILQRSINVALAFYESDLAFQQRAQADQNTTVIPHARFGSAFMQELLPGVLNVLDAKAQYRLMYKLVEMVNWDLSRDAEANRHAETIVEAYEMSQDLPSTPSTDDKTNLRQMRRLNSLRIAKLALPNQETARSTPAPIATTPAGVGLPNCVSQLYNHGGVSSSAAARFCQQNQTSVFISCVTRLYNHGGLAGSAAADHCLTNQSEPFVNCTVTIYQSGGNSGSAAAANCQRNSGTQFSSCVAALYQHGGLSGSGAAANCHQNSTPKFSSCTVQLYQHGGMSGARAASTCLSSNP